MENKIVADLDSKLKLEKPNKKYAILWAPGMKWHAKELIKGYPYNFIPFKIDWKFFPDGTPNFFIHGIENLRYQDVLYLASWHSSESKMNEYTILLVLCESLINSLTISLPYLNTGTMERVDIEGQVATANVDARLFSSLPRVGNTIPILNFDPHTLGNRFYFHGSAALVPITAMNIFRESKFYDPNDNIAIAFPDEGAAKRFGRFFSDVPLIVCSKVRKGNKRFVTIKEGEPKGKKVWIVDDLVHSGGTLIECMHVLFNEGASEVNAFVTHAVCENQSWKRFTKPNNGNKITHFVVTNTYPTVTELRNQEPFNILSITSELVKHLSVNPL